MYTAKLQGTASLGLTESYRLATERNILADYPTNISRISTECPRIYRKCVLHLLKYICAVYLSRCSTNLRLLLGH